MLKKQNRVINYLILLWIFLTSTAPFIFFRWPNHPYKLLSFSCLAIILLIFLFKPQRLTLRFDILILTLFQIAFYIFGIFYYKDFSLINYIIQICSLLIIVLFIINYIGFSSFIVSFIYVMSTMGVLGCIALFWHILFGITPIFSVSYGDDVSYFLGITTTNVFIDAQGIRILRFSGFFDEPGTFALFSLFSLILNKIYLNNSRLEKILIVSTLFTLSIAFYFSLVVYLGLYYFNIKKLLLFFFVGFLIFVLFEYFKESNPVVTRLYDFTIGRLFFKSDGLESSNRGGLMENDLKIFSSFPLLGVGNSVEVGGANLFSVFARFGIIGWLFYNIFILYLLVVSLFRFNLKNRSVYIKSLVLLILIMFYRPELSSLFSMLLLYSIIYSTVRNEST